MTHTVVSKEDRARTTLWTIAWAIAGGVLILGSLLLLFGATGSVSEGKKESVVDARSTPARVANPCGPPVRLIAYPGVWSDEIAKRPNCHFVYDRDASRGGTEVLRRTIQVRHYTANGKECEERFGPADPQKCFAPISSLRFASAEAQPIPVVVRFCPVGWSTCPDD